MARRKKGFQRPGTAQAAANWEASGGITVILKDRHLLKALRTAAGYKGQSGLATQVGVSKSYIGHLESGRNERVTLVVADAIASALGVSRGVLFHSEEQDEQ